MMNCCWPNCQICPDRTFVFDGRHLAVCCWHQRKVELAMKVLGVDPKIIKPMRDANKESADVRR